LFNQKSITEKDFLNYNDMYETVISSLRFPDLIIYLRASIWTLISRIRKRGRDYERSIDKEYLAQLNHNYEEWVERYAKHHRVLIVDTDNLDIETDKSRLNEILKKIGLYETQIELFPNINQI